MSWISRDGFLVFLLFTISLFCGRTSEAQFTTTLAPIAAEYSHCFSFVNLVDEWLRRVCEKEVNQPSLQPINIAVDNPAVSY